MEENTILDSIINLHTWRESFNGNKFGYGYDFYSPSEKYDYAEAYALWGRGYLKLYQLTNNKSFFEMALNCADYLISNKNTSYNNYSWGLPWDWEERPKNVSYITTTTFVGEFLLELYKYSKDLKYLDILKSIADWIVYEGGYVDEKKFIWFFYSNHPSHDYPIINSNSMASGFFSQLFSILSDKRYKRYSLDSNKFVLRNQDKFGYWRYSTKNPMIDNIHMGFTIEGLCDTYKIFNIEDIGRSIIKSSNYYWNFLYKKDGSGIYFDQIDFLRKVKFSLKRFNNESPLMGYATAIRVFTYVSDLFNLSNKGEILISYLLCNLTNRNGYFKFKKNHDYAYIRDEGHIFDALATYLLSSKNIKN